MGMTISDNYLARLDRPLEGESSTQSETSGPAKFDLAPSQEAYYKRLTQLCHKGDLVACGTLRKIDGTDRESMERSDF